MDTERYRRLRQLFAEARRLASDARAALLERECADDPDLRREVEGLLAHDVIPGEDATDVLRASVEHVATSPKVD